MKNVEAGSVIVPATDIFLRHFSSYVNCKAKDNAIGLLFLNFLSLFISTITGFLQCQLLNISYCPPTEDSIPQAKDLVIFS